MQPLNFEFMSCDIPQHNNLAKLAFPYLVGIACVMMGSALVPDNMCVKVALEAIECATQLDGLVLIDVNGELAIRDMHMFGENPK